MDAKRYEIATPLDFLKVPVDRRAICLREFSVWLDIVAGMPSCVRLRGSAFIWVDDGLGEARVYSVKTKA